MTFPEPERERPTLAQIALQGFLAPVQRIEAAEELAGDGAPDWHDSLQWREYSDMQREFMDSPAKRKVLKAGRRGGKTTGLGGLAVKAFLSGSRVLYTAPTADQLDHFWAEIRHILALPLHDKKIRANRSRHQIWIDGGRARIRAKTVWLPDDIRGDYADLLLLDEYQLMSEDLWATIAQPMLLDNDGDAVFAFTVPSILSQAASKARDKQHAIKLYRQYLNKPHPDWELFSFTSMDNPHISQEAVERLRESMSDLAFRQEILAEDIQEIPGAMWNPRMIEAQRVQADPLSLDRIAVGVDPPGSPGTECGIVVVGMTREPRRLYVLADASMKGSPDQWARKVIEMYQGWSADRIYAEVNYGGDMVEGVLRNVDPSAAITQVRATRGKIVRAESVQVEYEQGRVSHVGTYADLESEMCSYTGDRRQASPNRLDALVWACKGLLGNAGRPSKWLVGVF